MLEAASAFAWLIQSGSVSVEQLTEMIAERDRRIRLEGHIAGLEEAKQIAITEGNTPESEGGNMLRWDACDNVRLFIRVRIDELSAPVPAERAGDAVCPTCKGEMTIMTKEAGAGHSDDLAEYEF